MFVRPLTVSLTGEVDQDTLNELLRRLRMRQTGRLTDDWDEILGRRRVDVDGIEVRVTLSRPWVDGLRWTILVFADDPLPEWFVDELERETTEAVTASGLAVSQVTRGPSQTAEPTRAVSAATTRALTFRLAGTVDQPVLADLLRRLEMNTVLGQLADDRDEYFGRRRINVDGSDVRVTLCRKTGDGVRWVIYVRADGGVAESIVTDLEHQITNAVRGAGLTVTDVVRGPLPANPPPRPLHDQNG